jgi:hypothetical protein
MSSFRKSNLSGRMTKAKSQQSRNWIWRLGESSRHSLLSQLLQVRPWRVVQFIYQPFCREAPPRDLLLQACFGDTSKVLMPYHPRHERK